MRRADKLITSLCRLSVNQGAFTSWNTQGLSKPVMGLLYLYLYLFTLRSVGDTGGHFNQSQYAAPIYRVQICSNVPSDYVTLEVPRAHQEFGFQCDGSNPSAILHDDISQKKVSMILDL